MGYPSLPTVFRRYVLALLSELYGAVSCGCAGYLSLRVSPKGQIRSGGRGQLGFVHEDQQSVNERGR